MRSTFISIIFLAAAISPALGAPAAMGSLNALARRSDLTPGDIDEGFIVPLVGAGGDAEGGDSGNPGTGDAQGGNEGSENFEPNRLRGHIGTVIL